MSDWVSSLPDPYAEQPPALGEKDDQDKRSYRKARVGNQDIEERGPYRFLYVCDQYKDGMTFDEAVFRASTGERLWEPWF